jgi:hypothetical protein
VLRKDDILAILRVLTGLKDGRGEWMTSTILVTGVYVRLAS